jgi:methionyl-tRNA formyltransferase
MGPTTFSAIESLAPKFNLLGLVRNNGGAQDDPTYTRAREFDIPVFTDVSPSAVAALITDMKPDCVVVSSYNRILNSALIECCPFVNVHYAPLPQYRGRANVNWALINDEPSAAITIHKLAPELDAGDILYQQMVPIRQRDTVADLYRKLNDIQQQYLAVTVRRLLDGYHGTPQDHRLGTYGCTRLPIDGEIDWQSSTRKIDCMVRALAAPYPGAYTYFRGKRLVVWNAEPVKDPPFYAGRIPGRVISVSPSSGHVDVLTGDGILRVREVQSPGGQSEAAANVIKSVRETLGFRISNLLERIQLLELQVKKLLELQQGDGSKDAE